MSIQNPYQWFSQRLRRLHGTTDSAPILPGAVTETNGSVTYVDAPETKQNARTR